MLPLDLQLSLQLSMVHDVFGSQPWCQSQSCEFHLHSDNMIVSKSYIILCYQMHNCDTRFMHTRVSASYAANTASKITLLYLRLCGGCAGNLQITGKVAFPGHISYTHGTCSLSPVRSFTCVHAWHIQG